ncbi:response regulator [Methanoregula sp.]|uniref:response regulator n=1 Tax=Methanoregula sp. TaxID=2052170 RepID=UPI00236F9071|nr:response regulator [Methanoregula sp.]MDD1685864.1 response regulator [Methanoregula sp.]
MTGPAIFIVEDEAIVANDIRETLISLGYTAAGTAKSGEIALEKIKTAQPDLVLMDIHLAGQMDGVDVAGKVHALYDIPVIYLTAYADKTLLERAKVTEPYGYVVKPYDERELHSVIEMALYKHHIEREIKKRDAILFAVSSAVEWLLRVSRKESPEQIRDFNANDIRDILEPVGLALDAGAIGIFRIQPGTTGSNTVSMVYEWGCPEYHTARYKPELSRFTWAAMGLSRWENLLVKGEDISALMSTIPNEERPLLDLLGVKSGVILPIFIHDNLFGFIGFFDLTERTRSPDEIEALRITANLLGAALGYG